MPSEPLPLVQPKEAIAAFKSKGFEIAFDWRDVWQEENTRAFTVAKAMSRDLLEDIREAVQSAIDDGTTLAQFQKKLRPKLVKRGWWGRKLMVDPADPTGVAKVVQLGSPARLRTIYQTNLRTSYMTGRWQRIQRSKAILPFIRYFTVGDTRVRDEHAAWNNTVLPVDHPWWDTHFPPCGWNCRCDAQPLNQRMLDRRGWSVSEPARFPERDYVNKRTGEVTRLERGIDPGWSYNPGKAPLDGLTPSPRTKDDGPDGVEGALNSTLLHSDYQSLSGFFAAFNLDNRDAAIRGRVFIDAAEWPLPISAGLLRGSDGAIVRLDPDKAAALDVAAQILIDPDLIGWVWVTGRDGRAMLVRRYISTRGVVDIGRGFWRWHAGSPAGFRSGHVVWTRDEGALATFNPRQARDADGKWRKHSRGPGTMDVASATAFAASAAAGGSGEARHDLEPLSDQGARKLEALGLDGNDKKGGRKMVSLDRDRVGHSFKKHGTDKRGQIAITAEDFANIPQLISNGRISHGTPRVDRGTKLVHIAGKANGREYGGALEVRKHTIVSRTLYRKK